MLQLIPLCKFLEDEGLCRLSQCVWMRKRFWAFSVGFINHLSIQEWNTLEGLPSAVGLNIAIKGRSHTLRFIILNEKSLSIPHVGRAHDLILGKSTLCAFNPIPFRMRFQIKLSRCLSSDSFVVFVFFGFQEMNMRMLFKIYWSTKESTRVNSMLDRNNRK